MWAVTLIVSCIVAAQVTAREIEVACREFDDFAPVGTDASPSTLAGLTVELATVGGEDMLNISWAINIDSSINYLTGTRIVISGESSYHCDYNPPLAKADLTAQQEWFHYLVRASDGYCYIQAANLPLPPLGSGLAYKLTSIEIFHPEKTSVTTKSPQITTAAIITEPTTSALRVKDVTVAVFGGLAGLMILCSCYLIYKSCGTNVAKSFCFNNLPAPPMVPIPVLMVYPAKNSAFQRAIVALAEFLQWHGGCSVAVDMWQQGKIAELGPMRWLAEQAKAADRVLIVCPSVETPSHCPPNHSFPERSIPATAHDLYPLILNMVASHARSASDLAKFWVVELGEPKDKRPYILPHELRVCKTFCLMKDMNKLCKSLHAQSQDGRKISDLIFRPDASYSEKTTVKLREAIDKLKGHQPSISREVQELKSVATTV